MLLDIVDPQKEAQEKSKEIIVGIDFGTTNSLISIGSIEGVELISISGNNPLLSSELEISGHKIKSIKRLFGKNYQDIIDSSIINSDLKSILYEEEGGLYMMLDEKKIHIIEVASIIFSRLKSAAESRLVQEVKKAVVSVPAYFDDNAKSMVKHSASLAGIEVVRLIPEPTAACYFYGLDSKAEGSYMVYDLGGGTFDVSIISINNGVFKAEALGGDASLGGDDIDYEVAKLLADKYSISKEEVTTRAFLQKAKYIKETAKEIDGISLLPAEVDLAISYVIDKTIKICQKLHRASNFIQLDGILLVGGSTRPNIVSKKIAEAFVGIEIISNHNPDTIVALGAGMQGWNLYSKSLNPIIDLVPLSLGIELMGGLVDIIIPRNTPIPSSFTKKFTTHIDGQTGIEFHVIQGDRELASLCRSLARFSIKNLPPQRAGKIEVEVTFQIDVDGLLSVHASELASGQKIDLEIKPTFGLSNTDLYHMLKSAMDNVASDREQAQMLKLRQDIKATIKALEPLIRDDISQDNNDTKILVQKSNDLTQKLDILTFKELERDFVVFNQVAESFINRIINKSLTEYLSGRDINQLL